MDAVASTPDMAIDGVGCWAALFFISFGANSILLPRDKIEQKIIKDKIKLPSFLTSEAQFLLKAEQSPMFISGNDPKKEPPVSKDGSTPHIAAQTFAFRELASATKNFRLECLLGEGRFGRVYKGGRQKRKASFALL